MEEKKQEFKIDSCSIFDKMEELIFAAKKFCFKKTKTKYDQLKDKILYTFNAQILIEGTNGEIQNYFLTLKNLYQCYVIIRRK